jgi:hypothetical protein
MPDMTIRITNSTFESVATGDHATLEAAYQAAILAGLRIGTEEVVAGVSSVIVQVAVDQAEQRDAARGGIAISTARLLPSPSA